MISIHSHSIHLIYIPSDCCAFALLLSSFPFGVLSAILSIYVTPLFLYAHNITALHFMSSVECPHLGPVFCSHLIILFPWSLSNTFQQKIISDAFNGTDAAWFREKQSLLEGRD
jgi:hypothetical protein